MPSYGATPGILASDTQRSWGERVREWRTTRGLSTEELARVLAVSESLVKSWERGDRKVLDESRYAEKFRLAQAEAGETPGADPKDWVLSVWRAKVRAER